MDSMVACLILSFVGFAIDVGAANKDYWKPWLPAGDIPKHAVRVDKDRYVGRVETPVGRITAMVGAKKNVAVAVHKKRGLYRKGIEIFCSKRQQKLYWEPVNWQKHLPNEIPENAILAGFQKDIGAYVYVGRVKKPNLYKVGKVIPPQKQGAGLWIWNYDKPLHVTKFELLRSNNTEY